MQLNSRYLTVTLILLALGIISVVLGQILLGIVDLVGMGLFLTLWLRRR